MTSRYALLLLSVFALGCGSGAGDGKSAEKSKDKGKQDDKKSEASSAKGTPGTGSTITIDGPAQSRSDIRVAEVALRQLPQHLTAAGQITVNEDRTVHIGTYSDGRITEVLATVGDFVRKGQVLARMHSHTLHETVAAYEMALQDVLAKQNALAYAERFAQRMQNLLEVKSASLQEVERAQAGVLEAQTALKNAKINVTKEEDHLADILRVSAAQLPALLKAQVDSLPILSPISGTVTERKITPGSVVQPGNDTFTVSDLSSVWMLASVNETDVGKLKVGRRAQLLTQAFPNQPFPGVVTRLGASLDPQTRTLQARITLLNSRMQLRPEMFANAEIEVGPSRGAIFLPEDAIQEINGSPVVFVRGSNNKFTVRPVSIAHTLNGEAEIETGIKAGDHVVVKGSFVVKSEMLKSQIGE